MAIARLKQHREGQALALRVPVFDDNSAVEAPLSLPCRSQRFINNLLSQMRSVFQ